MDEITLTAFAGHRRVAAGSVDRVVRVLKQRLDAGEREAVLVFEDATGQPVDFDLRGTMNEALARIAEHPRFAGRATPRARPGPGRPRLGVVSREVSLLPRHWSWLESHPGGISATLRKLVDEARKREGGPEQARRTRDAVGRFMWAVAGDLPGFEEASRALYAGETERLAGLIGGWPRDVRRYVLGRLEAAADLDTPS